MSNITEKVRQITQRTSLTGKLILMAILVGTVTGGILDHFQNKQLSFIFHKHLNETLHRQSQKDRTLFDNHVRSHHHAVDIIISQKKFTDYVANIGWATNNQTETKHHNEKPIWLPKTSVLRSLPQSRFFFLIDGQGKVRETYRNTNEAVPQPLIEPSALLRQLSHNQTYLTDVEGTPYILTTELITDDPKRKTGILMLASPLDDEFLFSALNSVHRDSIVALANEDKNLIVASSQPDLIPAGTSIDTLQGKYLITGESFFDYGASDLKVHFISLISQSKYDNLSKEILTTGRSHRTIASVILILSFFLIILWITGHINKLTRKIIDFSEHNLDAKPHTSMKGDQLLILEERFQVLTDEIIAAQDKLKQKVKTLSGFLPICSSCKKIRDDKGYWKQIEGYIRDHSEAEFTHGICPECTEKFYSELNQYKDKG